MSGSFSGAKAPDYNVTAFDKVTKSKNKIGAAWIQPDGSLRIKFDPFIALPADMSNVTIACWPNDRDSKLSTRKTASKVSAVQPPPVSASSFSSELLPDYDDTLFIAEPVDSPFVPSDDDIPF